MKSGKQKSGNQSPSPSFPASSAFVETANGNGKHDSVSVSNQNASSISESNRWKSFAVFWFLIITCLSGVLVQWNNDLQAETKDLQDRNEKLILELKKLQSNTDGSVSDSFSAGSDVASSKDVDSESTPVVLTEQEHYFSIMLHTQVFFVIMSFIIYLGRNDLKVLLKIIKVSGSTLPGEAKKSGGGDDDSLLACVSAKEYILYRMDCFLSRSSSAKPISLLVATYFLMFIGGVMYWFCNLSEEMTMGESMWIVWTFIADPGTHADQDTASARIIALFVTIGGMLIFALMIGIIADGVSDLLDDLKKGRSRVIETGHTLILGWSDKTLPTIFELCIANESEGGGVIVVLAERSKEEMEEAIHMQLSKQELLGTVIVCRSGSPILMTDLMKVSAQTARSVIVMADPEVGADESDALAVRIVMSLTGIHVNCHCVVEMCDIDNRELVLLVGKGMVETVVSHDIIGRLMIQCARQPGLAQILEQLLGFEGDEFYIQEWPSLVGKTFREAAFRFESAVPIGIKPADPVRAAALLEQYSESVVTDLSDDERYFDDDSDSGVDNSDDDIFSSTNPKKIDRYSSRARSKSDTNASPSSILKPKRVRRLKKRLSDPGDKLPAVGFSDEHESYKTSVSATEDVDNALMNMKYSRPKQKRRRSRKISQDSRSTIFGTGLKTTILNPPNSYVIQEGDSIIVLAEDDDTYEACDDFPTLEAKTAFSECKLQTLKRSHEGSEKLLFCGWRRDIDDMILELDKIVEPGSELTLMSTVPVEKRIEGFNATNKINVERLRNLTLKHQVGNQVIRRHLELLTLNQFDSILILADEALETNMQTSDSRSLASLLLIRDIIQKSTVLENKFLPSVNTSITSSRCKEMKTEKSENLNDSDYESDLERDVGFEEEEEGEEEFERKHASRSRDDIEYKNKTTIQRKNSESSLSVSSSSSEEWREYFKAVRKDPSVSPKKKDLCRNKKRSQTQEPARDRNPMKKLSKAGCIKVDVAQQQRSGMGVSSVDGPKKLPVIISEILDSRTKSLISVAEISDYVMSNEIVASAMAMVSEDRSVNRILSELLSSSGNEIRARSCRYYCKDSESLSFWQITARARKRREVALGYKAADEDQPTLNPRNKSMKRTWKHGDLIIVLSED